jgi:predicted lactoylglutathione lyase
VKRHAAVVAMNEAAAAHGGHADVNPIDDRSFIYSCDPDPGGHMWAVLWIDPAAMPAAAS